MRVAIAQIAQGNIDAFSGWLLDIDDPARRCEVFLKVLAYHIPPLARVETSVTTNRSLEDLGDDELLALIGEQLTDQEKN